MAPRLTQATSDSIQGKGEAVGMDGEYKIIPYTTVDGVPTFRDSEIAGWFDRMEADGMLPQLFFDAGVLSGADLVRLVKTPGVMFFTVWDVGRPVGRSAGQPEGDGGGLAAVFWLRDFIHNAAYMHWGIFKAYRGPAARKISRFVLETIFDVRTENARPFVSTLLGLVLVDNVPAVKFSQEMGAVQVGVIPKLFTNFYDAARVVDGLLVCMTRERCVETMVADSNE